MESNFRLVHHCYCPVIHRHNCVSAPDQDDQDDQNDQDDQDDQDDQVGKVTIHGCGLPDSQTPGLPDSQTPGLPEYQTPIFLDSQSPWISWSEWLCCWGAPHIFQMKYLANMSIKVELLETWERTTTLLMWLWPVRMVSRWELTRWSWLGRYSLVILSHSQHHQHQHHQHKRHQYQRPSHSDFSYIAYLGGSEGPKQLDRNFV